MLIKTVVNRILDLKELDELEQYRINLNKVIKKHRRKLIRVKIYIRGEQKYKDKKLKLFLSRLVTLHFNRKVEDLVLSFNRLTHLIDVLDQATRKYLSSIKDS